MKSEQQAGRKLSTLQVEWRRIERQVFKSRGPIIAFVSIDSGNYHAGYWCPMGMETILKMIEQWGSKDEYKFRIFIDISEIEGDICWATDVGRDERVIFSEASMFVA